MLTLHGMANGFLLFYLFVQKVHPLIYLDQEVNGKVRGKCSASKQSKFVPDVKTLHCQNLPSGYLASFQGKSFLSCIQNFVLLASKCFRYRMNVRPQNTNHQGQKGSPGSLNVEGIKQHGINSLAKNFLMHSSSPLVSYSLTTASYLS